MINKVPFTDPSPDPKTHADELEPSELLVPKRKAAFQWPPDCLWPFVDQKADGDA
jgi:hypothetical protein